MDFDASFVAVGLDESFCEFVSEEGGDSLGQVRGSGEVECFSIVVGEGEVDLRMGQGDSG